MPIDEEFEKPLYIKTEDSEAARLIEHILTLPNQSYEYAATIQVVNAIDCSGEISFTARIRKGAADIICGKPWTNAAQRYTRQQIRKKEKERRRRLKHENSDT